MGYIKQITLIELYGLVFYYDEKKDVVGFPMFFNEETNNLDNRVGHQYWIKKSQAKAIVLKVLELNNRRDE